MSDDRPDWQTQGSESWKLTLPITRVQADRLIGDFDMIDPPPVFVVSEADPQQPDDWRLEVYFEDRPLDSWIAQIRAFIGVEGGALERLDDADWVTISQTWLPPIRAGRFYVHTAAHADAIPNDVVSFRIEASRAFGTGHHETTRGCLAMLSGLAENGRRFARVADIGTGTGLLAFAAHTLWPAAKIIATDIDPVAIPVVAENMAANDIPETAMTLAIADGTDHPALHDALFDLVTANILAGPLIQLAPDLSRIIDGNGCLILAGLLSSQEADVLSAFETNGFLLEERRVEGDWPVLALMRMR